MIVPMQQPPGEFHEIDADYGTERHDTQQQHRQSNARRSLCLGNLDRPSNTSTICNQQRPARVVQWSDHLGAMPCAVERDVRSGRGSIRASARVRPPTKRISLFQIIPMHMMIREIIPDRKQRLRDFSTPPQGVNTPPQGVNTPPQGG